MQRKEYVILLAAISLCVVLLFCSCVKDLPDGGEINVDGRETLFAPAETTAPDQTTETEKPAETTSPVTETTAPHTETTAHETETASPETTDSVETENPVFTGGFSGLY